jgi:hypothetical protein
VIVHDVNRHDFQESENGIGEARLEGPQKAAVVFAQFEIGLLNEIVDNLGRLGPIAGQSSKRPRRSPTGTAG